MDKGGKKARVLVVEDESIVALDMRSRLSAMGYEVVGIASSGEDALEFVDSSVPDLILMDIRLQGELDGVETAEIIHRTADVPVIFVTAFADERTLARAKVTQAFGYILKPFQEREVLISIEMALYKHSMERDLKTSREWLSGTIHAITDGIVALDSAGNVVFMNREAERLLSTTSAAALGKPLSSVWSFSENRALADLLNASSDGKPSSAETDTTWGLLDAAVSRVPVEVRRRIILGAGGEASGRVLSLRDVTADVRAVSEKTRLAAIVSNSHDSILSIDPELRILSWNLGAELMYGFSSAEMLGTDVSSLIPEERSRARFHAFVESVVAGEDVGRFELAKRCSSGKIISVSVSLSPLRDASGGVVEIACIERDVSAEKEYEDSLVQAKRNAEEASRTKSEFLSNMSHELRTPLNSIMGMIELSRDMAGSSEQKEYLDIARQSAENLLFLINSILDFSKIEAGKMRINSIPFSPVETVEECMEEVSVQAHRKGLSLVFRPSPDLPARVEGDPRRFKQILTNLLSNAIKFTETGVVRVDLSASQASDAAVSVFLLTVKDSGIGIDSGRLESIWESFTQLDGSSTRAYGGTGLGLSIVRSLAELMGGKVSAASELGKGSVFSVSIPFAVSDDPQISDPPPLPPNLSVILATEPGEDSAMLEELLSSWGCAVRSVSSIGEMIPIAEDGDAVKRLFIVDESVSDRRLLFSYFDAIPPGSSLRGKLLVLSNIGARDEPGWNEIAADARFLFKPIRRAALRKCVSELFSLAGDDGRAGSSVKPLPLRSDVAEFVGKEQSVSREQRVRSELASDAEIGASIERFLQEADAIGCLPGERLEHCAARCRRELEALRATVLAQFMFKVILACRREDVAAVDEELRRIREAAALAMNADYS